MLICLTDPLDDLFVLNDGIKLRIRKSIYYNKDEVLEIVRELFEMAREMHEAGVVALIIDP